MSASAHPLQVLQLSGEIEHARHELDGGTRRYTELQKQLEDRVAQLQEELDGLRADHAHAEHQRELLEGTSEEQRAELIQLRLAISELELQKESLLFQGSSHEGTISSLKSQVGHVIVM